MKQAAKKNMIRRLSQSEAVRAGHLARRRAGLILVDGVGPGRLVTLQPEQFKKLNVDERYQRIRITATVNELVHVIRSGGLIPDPITLAERPDGSLWIVDGQQRFWAHNDCQTPLRAMIYAVKDFEAERNLFLALNHYTRVKSDITVKAWPGAAAEMLRERHADESSPYHMDLSYGFHNARPYKATPVMKGIAALLNPTWAPQGKIENILSRCDSTMKAHGAKGRDRVASFLDLIPLVMDGRQLTMLSAIALGHVAGRKWASEIEMPDKPSLNRLHRMNWDSIAPTRAARFLPLIESEIEKRWREVR